MLDKEYSKFTFKTGDGTELTMIVYTVEDLEKFVLALCHVSGFSYIKSVEFESDEE